MSLRDLILAVAALIVATVGAAAAIVVLPGTKIVTVFVITFVALVLVLLAILIIPRRASLWEWFRRPLGSRPRYQLAIMALVLVSLVAGLIFSGRHGQRPTSPTTLAPKKETVVLVAQFRAPDPTTAGKYIVSETIHQRLQYAFRRYEDVRVAALTRVITAQDGSDVARRVGKDSGAAIVIWGWYGKSSTTVALSAHFELLAVPPRYVGFTLDPDAQGQIRKEPVAKLESFDVQDILSSEMLFLTELAVGLARVVAQDWPGAISHLTGALNESQGRKPSAKSLVRFYRGMAYLVKKGTTRTAAIQSLRLAVADFSEAISLDPRHAMAAYFNRAMAHIKTYLLTKAPQELEHAVSDLSQAIRRKPDADNYRERGSAYALKSDFRNAFADFNKAIQLRATPENYRERGRAYELKRDWRRAIADFTQAIRIKPNAEDYRLRADAYIAIGDDMSALADVNRAIELEPREPEHYYKRGLGYVHRKDFDAALQDFTKAIELGRNNSQISRYYMDRAAAYLNKGELEKGIKDLDWVISHLPGLRLLPDIGWRAYSNRGQAYEKRNEPARAIADYTRAIELNDSLKEAYLRRGRLYMGEGEYDKAVRDLSKLLKLDSEFVLGYANRGLAYMAMHQYEKAASDFSEAIRREPHNDILYVDRSRAYTLAGEGWKAAEDLQHVLSHSKEPDLRRIAAEELKALQRR